MSTPTRCPRCHDGLRGAECTSPPMFGRATPPLTANEPSDWVEMELTFRKVDRWHSVVALREERASWERRALEAEAALSLLSAPLSPEALQALVEESAE